jgi:hypothetical protein
MAAMMVGSREVVQVTTREGAANRRAGVGGQGAEGQGPDWHEVDHDR